MCKVLTKKVYDNLSNVTNVWLFCSAFSFMTSIFIIIIIIVVGAVMLEFVVLMNLLPHDLA